MSGHPTLTGPQGFNGDDFQVEAFVPAFNEASVVTLEDIETVRVYRTPNSEFFSRGLRAILRARVECPSINFSIDQSEYYVNGYGDVVSEEEVSAYLHDSALRSDSHDAFSTAGRLRFEPYFRFVSPGVKLPRTRHQRTPQEIAYGDRPKTRGIKHFGINMSGGSAIVAKRRESRLAVKKGFSIGRGAIVAVSNGVGSNVDIGEGATVSVSKIGADVQVESDTNIKGYFLALESC